MFTSAECKINGILLTEFKYENLTGTPSVEIVYALTEGKVKEGVPQILHTHGKVTASGRQLSVPTLKLLKQLVEAIEEDLLPRHFGTNNSKKVTEENEDATGIATEEPESTNQI